MEKVPVLSQNARGTCVAHAAVAMKMWQELQERQVLESFSREYVYTFCKQLDGIPQDEGTYPRIAMDVLTKYGTCSESMCPYQSDNNHMILTDAMHRDAGRNRIRQYARVRKMGDLQDALIRYGPITIGVPVYKNWETKAVANTGTIPMPAGKLIGGHALLVYGWTKDHILIRNSWGQWGDKGNGKLPISYPGLFDDAWLAVDMTSGMQLIRGNTV
jgi:C1A family cysteine protease